MRNPGRVLVLLTAALWLAGCTAMMIGGNSGDYQPPKDQCDDGDAGCKSR